MRSVRFDHGETALSALVRDGEGPPLVMVPGVMADAETWRPVADAVKLPNPVVVLNRRGRTPSGPIGAGYSVRTEVDDLLHVLGELGTEAHVFGWSYGALIALEAAATGKGVRSLTLYEPVSRPFGDHAVPALREAADRGDLDRAVEIVNIDVSGFTSEYVADLRRDPVWDVLRPLAAPLADELAALNDHEPSMGAFGELDVPVTLLLGEVNRDAPPYGTAFAAFTRAMPRARVVSLPGQGHLAHAQAPDLLGDAIAGAVTDAVRAAG